MKTALVRRFILRSKVFKGSFGFTLIELMVAISIVGIVFAIIISSSSAIQRSARDAQRQSDLRTLQSILQQYYGDQGYFPSGCCNTPLKLDDSNPITQLTSSIGTPTPPSSLKTYAVKLPVDPTTDQTYCYKSYSSLATANNNALFYTCDNSSSDRCHYYILCAKLEGASTGSSACQTACGSGYNFEVNALK